MFLEQARQKPEPECEKDAAACVYEKRRERECVSRAREQKQPGRGMDVNVPWWPHERQDLARGAGRAGGKSGAAHDERGSRALHAVKCTRSCGCGGMWGRELTHEYKKQPAPAVPAHASTQHNPGKSTRHESEGLAPRAAAASIFFRPGHLLKIHDQTDARPVGPLGETGLSNQCTSFLG